MASLVSACRVCPNWDEGQLSNQYRPVPQSTPHANAVNLYEYQYEHLGRCIRQKYRKQKTVD